MYRATAAYPTGDYRRSKMLARVNVTSKAYTLGTYNLKENNSRSYFFIVAEAPLTIEMNNGGGLISLQAGGFYEPLVAPINPIQVVATGNFVISSDKQNLE